MFALLLMGMLAAAMELGSIAGRGVATSGCGGVALVTVIGVACVVGGASPLRRDWRKEGVAGGTLRLGGSMLCNSIGRLGRAAAAAAAETEELVGGVWVGRGGWTNAGWAVSCGAGGVTFLKLAPPWFWLFANSHSNRACPVEDGETACVPVK